MYEMKFQIPRSSLNENKMMRRQFLDEYFPSGLIPFEEVIDNKWQITAFVPTDSAYYVDPNLENALENWQHPVSIETIGNYRSFYKNAMISFYDSWSIYYWSLVFSFLQFKEETPGHVTLLHVDDHQDLNSPLLAVDNESYECLLSGNKVSFLNPSSIKESVLIKSIGIDSFITPLVNNCKTFHISHLRCSHLKGECRYGLRLLNKDDELLSTDKQRSSLIFEDEGKDYLYTISSDVKSLLNQVNSNSLFLLHIDCDAFSNRFNLDTNWKPDNVSIDLNLDCIKLNVRKLLYEVSQKSKRVFINIALSPGFFPSEYWDEICKYILITAEEYGIVQENEFSEYLNSKYPEELRYEIKSN